MARKKKEKSSAPKLGAQYQAAKLGVQVLSLPANKLENQGFTRLAAESTWDIARGVYGPAYLQGAGVAVADTVLSSKMLHHANALSRRSVTAVAPEIYAAAMGARNSMATKKITGFSDDFTRVTTGYAPQSTTFNAADAFPYFGLKYGGWIVRKAANAVPAVGDKVKRFLSMAGVTL